MNQSKSDPKLIQANKKPVYNEHQNLRFYSTELIDIQKVVHPAVYILSDMF